ncbi:MAG: formyltransferase family protein [Nanoarchaeota archaeon]
MGVVICPTMGKKSLWLRVKFIFDFYGFVDFSRMLYRYFVSIMKGMTLENILLINNVLIYRQTNVNSEQFIEYWRSKDLDVIISIAAPLVFKDKLLNLPHWGCLNIHHAKLPFYKGMMPNFWQLYYGEKYVGISVHKMNSKIDEGEIILMREISVQKDESLDALIKRTKRIGAHCIIESLDMINKNSFNYLFTSKEKGSYFTFPTKENVSKFRKQGNKIL